MCVRYVGPKPEQAKLIEGRDEFSPEGDHFPGDAGEFVVHGGEVIQARWGIQPPWSEDPNFGRKNAYNARAETVAEKPTFRTAFRARRCVIPVAAFYERSEGRWRRILPTHDDAFALAGLFEKPNERSPEPTYAMVTTEPNLAVAEVHDRMPVILAARDVEAWLDPKADLRELHALLIPCPPEWVRVEDGGPIGRRRKSESGSLFEENG